MTSTVLSRHPALLNGVLLQVRYVSQRTKIAISDYGKLSINSSYFKIINAARQLSVDRNITLTCKISHLNFKRMLRNSK